MKHLSGLKKAMNDSLLIEATYKGRSCLPCVYMHAAVLDILPAYTGRVTYSRVDISKPDGKRRYLDLSCSLFGRKGVFEHYRLAPIPALFIDGELMFDAIPSKDELEEAIDEKLQHRWS